MMLIKVELDASIVKKIEELIVRGSYTDIHQFLSVAIFNQLEEEISSTAKLDTNSGLLSSEISPSIPLKPSKTAETTTVRSVNPLRADWRAGLKGMQMESTQIEPKPSDLIWYFYNRFFPIKVVIYQLATIMVTQRNNWIDLGDLQVQAFEFAQEVATRLKNIEIRAKMPRNKKLSTGLPASSMELISLRGTARKKKDDKLIRGRTRFMDQIVGKYVPKERIFTGACFDLGLIGIRYTDENIYVSLTQLGKEFALLENPILDKDSFESAFSDKEVRFIFYNIYKRFRLENKIVKKIIEWLKIETLTSSQIDSLFKEENRKTFTVERIATMGRLSELMIVNWEIDRQGKSIYSLNQEKYQLLN